MRKIALATAFLLTLGGAAEAVPTPGSEAPASGVDEANAAVLAARDGKYDDAIRLFGAALAVGDLSDRGRAQALSYRGLAQASKGDYQAALADLDRAVALGSAYEADAYSYRGLIKTVTGDNAGGAADLAHGAKLLVWPYNAMWLHLARAKAGIPDTDDVSLAKNVATFDLRKWPGPIISFFLGKATRAEVMTAAAMADRRTNRLCDANFYLGEYDLSRHDPRSAHTLLEKAATDCPFSAFERMGAKAELAHLDAPAPAGP